MFEPNFRYTDSIVNRLVEITSSRDAVVNAYMVPKWEVSLRRDALLRSAHASTSIEGNPLSLEEVSELAKGREVLATRRAKQEVLNYLDVLEGIEGYLVKGAITEETVLRLHGDLSKEVLDDPRNEGRYRKVRVYVGNSVTGEVIFMPPPPSVVKGQMADLIEWMASDAAAAMNPVLVAGIAHYEFVRIHPFVDGNGRTARALATLVLVMREFDIKRFFTLDDYYDSDRPSYYRALNEVDQDTLDLTGWLDYFTQGVLVAVSEVRTKVLKLSMDRKRVERKGQIALTRRQIEIVQHVIDNGKITTKEVAQRYQITIQAALKELKKLVAMEVLSMQGKGRATHFVLA
ncbi:MAG: Fic family protein [Thermoplasmata archaeon]|nr:Fic family protein [Thermoplasmata archaeon]